MVEDSTLVTDAPENTPEAFLHHLYSVAVKAAHPGENLRDYLEPVSGDRVRLVGAGKAAASMARAAERCLSSEMTGLVIVPDGYAASCERIEVVEASHPLTDSRGLHATTRIINIVKDAGPQDTVVCLLSGGASALLAAPAEGVRYEEKRNIVDALVRSGAAIDEINCVRKHLSIVKGGRLAAMAMPARVLTLIVSDVVGDDPTVIGSGPSVPDPTTCAEALAILVKYTVSVPAHIEQLLRAGTLESPKVLSTNASTHIVISPKQSLAAAAAEVRRHGLSVHVLGDQCLGHARQGARHHAEIVRAINRGDGPVVPPCVILSGGEYTVPVRGSGCGGPNTEFALSLALELKSASNVWALAADTDGVDGTSGAAGAIITPETLARAKQIGGDVRKDLAANDSAGFFEALQNLVTPGPTLTNVNDFRAIFVKKPPR